MLLNLQQIKNIEPRRDHGDIILLRESIKSLGLINPLTVDSDFNLLAGRRRFQAVKELGWQQVEVNIIANVDQLRAFGIALAENIHRKNLTEVEEYVAIKEYHKLRQKIEGDKPRGHIATLKQFQNTDLLSLNKSVGWSQTETAADLHISQPTVARAIKIATAIEQHPDLVRLGSGRAILSEARHREQKREAPPQASEGCGILLTVGDAGSLPVDDETVHCFVTSPPYNIGVKTGHLEQRTGGRSVNGGMAFAGPLYEGEALEEGEYQQWQQQVLAHWHEKAAPGASLFYVHKVRQKGGQAIHPVAWLISTPWVLRQEVVWDRRSTHNHEPSYFWPQDERVYWLTKGKPRVTSPEAALYGTVWQIPFQQQEGDWHPAPFPAELVRRCLLMATLPGDLVVDPFGGSMTTCRVAAALGRRSLGVDIREDYVRRAQAELGG